MPSFTDVDDVAVELGRDITHPETGQVQAWIGRVEARIRARIADLELRAANPAYRTVLVGVVAAVVVRKVNNPTGMRSERIDDYYYDRGASAASAAELWPSAAEWAELLGVDTSGGAFSTRPSFMPDRAPGGGW